MNWPHLQKPLSICVYQPIRVQTNSALNQPGGGDGEKRAGFRIGFWLVNYRGPHLTRKRWAVRENHIGKEMKWRKQE